MYLEMSVESDAAAVLVATGEGHKVEDLGEGGAGGDRAALAGLQAGHMAGELSIHHSHFAVLNHVDLIKRNN